MPCSAGWAASRPVLADESHHAAGEEVLRIMTDQVIGLPKRPHAGRPLPRDSAESVIVSLGQKTLRQQMVADVSVRPRFTVGGLLAMLVFGICLALLGFCVVRVPNLWRSPVLFSSPAFFPMSFQLPLAVFGGALLGPLLGPAAILIAIFAGIFWMPIFSGGGGIGYISTPGFGYWLGMVAGAVVAGRYTGHVYANSRLFSRSLSLAGAALLSVLVVHAVGMMYSLGLALSQQISWPELSHWLVQLTVIPLPYDCMSAVVFFGFTRWVRLTMWPALY
ncbi:MAG: biotin transporter BioY [Candidatus Melainabacteria bacterium]